MTDSSERHGLDIQRVQIGAFTVSVWQDGCWYVAVREGNRALTPHTALIECWPREQAVATVRYWARVCERLQQEDAREAA